MAIVVHSTWRYTHDVDELKLLLGALGPKVVGATPRGPRYESIQWWLQMNPSFADHRILDDDASEFPTPPPPNLILCNPTTGVAAPVVLAALRRQNARGALALGLVLGELREKRARVYGPTERPPLITLVKTAHAGQERLRAC